MSLNNATDILKKERVIDTNKKEVKSFHTNEANTDNKPTNENFKEITCTQYDALATKKQNVDVSNYEQKKLLVKGKFNLEEQLLTHPNILCTLEEINKKSSNVNSAKFLKVNLENFDFESENNFEYYYNIHKFFDCNKNNNDIINDNYFLKNFFLIRNKKDFVNIIESPSSIKAIKKLKYSIKDLIKIPFEKFTTLFKEHLKKGKDSVKNAYQRYEKVRLERILECKFERKNIIEFEGNEDTNIKDRELIKFFRRIIDKAENKKINDSSIDDKDKIYIEGRIRKSLNINGINNQTNKFKDNLSLKNILTLNNHCKDNKNEMKFNKDMKDNNLLFSSSDENIKNSKSKVNTRSIEENLYFKENLKNKKIKKLNWSYKHKDLGNLTKKNQSSNSFNNSSNNHNSRDFSSDSNKKKNIYDFEELNNSYSKKQLISANHFDKQEFIKKKFLRKNAQTIPALESINFDEIDDNNSRLKALKQKLQNLEKEQSSIKRMKEKKEKNNFAYKQVLNNIFEREIRTLQRKIFKIENLVVSDSSKSKFQKKKELKSTESTLIKDRQNTNHTDLHKKIKSFDMIKEHNIKDVNELEAEYKLKNVNYYKTLKNIEIKLSYKPINDIPNISKEIKFKENSDKDLKYPSVLKKLRSGDSTNKYSKNYFRKDLKNINRIQSSTNRDSEELKKTLEFKELKIKTQIKNIEINVKNNYLMKNKKRDVKIRKINEIHKEEEILRLQKQLEEYENKIKLGYEKNDEEKKYRIKFLENNFFDHKKNIKKNLNSNSIKKTYKKDNLIIENFIENDSSETSEISNKNNFENNKELNEYYVKKLNERILDKSLGMSKKIDMDRFLSNYKTTKSSNKYTNSPISIRSIWVNKNSLINNVGIETCKSFNSIKCLEEKLFNKQRKDLESTIKNINPNKGSKIDTKTETHKPISSINDLNLNEYMKNYDNSKKNYLDDLKKEKNCELFINQYKESLDNILESKISEEKMKEKKRIEKAMRVTDLKEKERIKKFDAEERLKAKQEIIELDEVLERRYDEFLDNLNINR